MNGSDDATLHKQALVLRFWIVVAKMQLSDAYRCDCLSCNHVMQGEGSSVLAQLRLAQSSGVDITLRVSLQLLLHSAPESAQFLVLMQHLLTDTVKTEKNLLTSGLRMTLQAQAQVLGTCKSVVAGNLSCIYPYWPHMKVCLASCQVTSGMLCLYMLFAALHSNLISLTECSTCCCAQGHSTAERPQPSTPQKPAQPPQTDAKPAVESSAQSLASVPTMPKVLGLGGQNSLPRLHAELESTYYWSFYWHSWQRLMLLRSSKPSTISCHSWTSQNVFGTLGSSPRHWCGWLAFSRILCKSGWSYDHRNACGYLMTPSTFVVGLIPFIALAAPLAGSIPLLPPEVAANAAILQVRLLSALQFWIKVLW